MYRLCILAAMISVLSGCATYGAVNEPQPLRLDTESTATRDVAPQADRSAGLKGSFDEAPLEDAELRISRNGWIRVDVGEEMAASKRLRKAADKFEATVMAFNDRSVTFKMPSDRLESLLDVIDGTEGWEIDEFDFSAWDRTGEFYSVEARVKSTQAVKDRMLKLLESANTVEEVLSISRKLEDLQVTLDGFETSIRDIKLHAGRVDVTVTFD
ncbi:MAG: DUF4349 domain-containing protein [Planctomycetes bacterium]|nr:DUF4349 domain-containing protein [Planctomycetota bacterium]